MSADDESLVPASDSDGWEPSRTVDGLDEKVLWEAAPGFASIALLRFAQGAGIPAAHRHASNQFMYCLSGRYAYESSGMVLEPGSFYGNPVGNQHGPTEALTDTVLLEIYDGRHYDEPGDEFDTPENRIGTHLLHANRLVNIWDVTLQPGESIGWHRHRYPYVVVTVDAGSSRIVEHGSGDERRVAGASGSVVYDPAGAHHMLENIGDTLIRDRLIEFKVPTNKRLPPRIHIPAR